MSLVLHGAPSSRTRRCIWTLEEVGAEYEFRAMDLAAGDHHSAEYLALNPNGRVPTLVDAANDLVLFESAAICQYIARKFPESGLLPADGSRSQAIHDQWMFWVTTELEQGLWSMGKHKFALPREQRIPNMLDTAMFEWNRATPVLATALESGGPYLLGSEMHLVDILVAHTLLWARGFNVPFGHKVLEEYLELMTSRDSYTRAKRFDT